MTDPEWQSLQSSWQAADGPLPDIQAHARARARRHRLTNAIFFAMIATGLVAFLPFIPGRELDDPFAAWVLFGFGVTVLLGLYWVQRGLGARRIGNPRDDLAFLERHVRAETRGAQVGRVCFGALALVMGIRAFWIPEWPVRLMALGFLATMLALALAMPWLVRRRVTRQQAEIVRWRSWLDEQLL